MINLKFEDNFNITCAILSLDLNIGLNYRTLSDIQLGWSLYEGPWLLCLLCGGIISKLAETTLLYVRVYLACQSTGAIACIASTMGKDINTYRAGVGSFATSLRVRCRAQKTSKYQSHHNGTDIHLQTLVTSMFLLSAFGALYCVMASVRYVEDTFGANDYDVCHSTTYISPQETMSICTYTSTYEGTLLESCFCHQMSS